MILSTDNPWGTEGGTGEQDRPDSQLSKWWQTESCARAFARARQKRDEKIRNLRTQVQAKREQLEREVNDWEVAE
jgi:hypothetical protein